MTHATLDRTEQVAPINLRAGDHIDLLALLDSPDAHPWVWHPLGDDEQARSELISNARQIAETELAEVISAERGGGGMVIIHTPHINVSVTGNHLVDRAA